MFNRAILRWFCVLIPFICFALIWGICVQQGWGFNNLLWGDHIRLNFLPYNILYQDYSLLGWQLRPVPGFFPNLLYELVAYLITKDFMLANLLIGAFELLAVWASFAVLLKSLKPERRWATAFAISGVMLNFCGVMALFSNFYHTLIGAYHVGNLITTMLLLSAFLHYLRKGAWYSIGLIPVLVFLGVISDRTIILTAIVPIMLLLVAHTFYRYLTLSRLKSWYWIILGFGIPTLLGGLIYILPPFLRGDRYVLTMQRGPDFNLHLIKDIFTYGQTWLGPLYSLVLILMIGWLVQEAFDKRLNKAERFVFVAIMIGAVINILSLVKLSPYPIFGTWYTLTPMFLLPGFALSVAISKLLPKYQIVTILLSSLLCLCVSLIQFDRDGFQHNVERNESVANIACLDTVQQHGVVLQSGLAAYDQAPLIRLLSKGRYQVFSSRVGFLQLWVNNMFWYLKPDGVDALRQYNFLMIGHNLKLFNTSMLKRIYTTYGLPDFTVTCPNHDMVAVYSSPQKHEAFNRSIHQQLLCYGENSGLEKYKMNVNLAVSNLPLKSWWGSNRNQAQLSKWVEKKERCDRTRAYLKQFPNAWSQAMELLNVDAAAKPMPHAHELKQMHDLDVIEEQQ